MDAQPERRHFSEHDWHSRDYVDDWIGRDRTRDDERRPQLRHMLSFAPYPEAAEIAVLDVGAGYGVVAEEVLNAFPNARVTLQDYSEPMFAHARARLAGRGGRIDFVLCDLRDADWGNAVGGPFDMAVSGIAIHNLRDHALMAQCYRSLFGTLKPGGSFLDYDLFDVAGGVDAHVAALEDAGFADVECVWHERPRAIVTARRP